MLDGTAGVRRATRERVEAAIEQLRCEGEAAGSFIASVEGAQSVIPTAAEIEARMQRSAPPSRRSAPS